MMPPTEPALTRAARNRGTADDPKATFVRSLDITADRDLRCPVQWTGQQAVVTLPQHIDISNVGQIREQLLWIINRGAAVLIADLTGTVSCDYSGADALARTRHRAMANGTELRLAVTADAVRRVLTLNGFDRLVAIYPDLGAAAAGTGRREQRSRTAADPAGTEELLDGAVAGLFAVGLVLQGAIDLPRDVTAQRISEALRRLDDIVREIRNHVFAERGQSTEPGLAWSPPPHVAEGSALAGNRPELLQRRVVQTANAMQCAAADIAALLERRAVLLTQPAHIDYPTEIKRWAALADQAGRIAECWIE
jgi:anti-anti-sigma factor